MLVLSACDASKDVSAPDLDAFEKLTPSLAQTAQQIRLQLDGELNPQLGSWQADGISASSAPRLTHLQFRAFTYADAELAALVQLGQASFLKLLDPVWGGVYQAAYQLDSKRQVIPGKRLADQAYALQTFAMAYQASGEVRFRNGIEAVDAFLQESLASDAGTFFTSQSEQPENLPSHITPQRYWSLRTEHERRRFGLSPVDRMIYTAENAAVISGYVQAFVATGESNYLQVATRTAARLLRERLTASGWMAQVELAKESEGVTQLQPMESLPEPQLLTQAKMGLALLDLYGASGDSNWLQSARTLAEAVTISARDDYDRTFAGAGDATVIASAANASALRLVAANSLVARFLYALSVYDNSPDLAELGVRVMQAMVDSEWVLESAGQGAETSGIAEAGLMLELLAAGYVEVSVVGNSEDLTARGFFAAGLRPYHPRKLLHFAAPGRFPDAPAPAGYICNPDLCSLPIIEPQHIAGGLRDFIAPARIAYP